MNDPKKDPFEIEDSNILTPQEHLLIGSTFQDPEINSHPFTPLGVIKGAKAEEVFKKRLRQKEIVSASAGYYFGLGIGEAAVIGLSMIDLKTGEVVSRVPRLAGIFYESTGKFIRDPEVLARYRLSEEGRRWLMVEGEGIKSSREGEVA